MGIFQALRDKFRPTFEVSPGPVFQKEPLFTKSKNGEGGDMTVKFSAPMEHKVEGAKAAKAKPDKAPDKATPVVDGEVAQLAARFRQAARERQARMEKLSTVAAPAPPAPAPYAPAPAPFMRQKLSRSMGIQITPSTPRLPR